jgi:hypothetical protein
VVRHDIAEARVLVVNGLLMGFLGRWWRIEVEAEDEFRAMAVVGIGASIGICDGGGVGG